MEETFLYINQKLVLPDLADKLALSSPEFIVIDIFQGGMGTCAKIQNLNKQLYAFKIIHISLLDNDTVLQRYIDEMKTWLTLSACNGVVEAFCLTKLNEIPCIAAQWMEYGNLRPFINQTNKDLFYRSIDRIASTLNWANKNYSIIHRDIKPENILLDNTGNAFIADWGLSRPISTQLSETNFENALIKLSNRIDITEAGSFLGTILYSSPEQILGMGNIDHRSDIYSLGCIMYEWETGRPPFVADTPQEIALQHLRSRPKQIGGIFKTTNFKVEKIIEKCLEKSPNNRYQTYSELLKDFEDVATKNSTFKKFVITERYKVPLIGEAEFNEKFKEKKLNATYSKDGKYAIIEQSETDPYFKEAESLIVIGEYEKAKNIFEGFYVHDFFKKIPDSSFVQYICVNFALSLRYIGEIEKGIFVLRTLDEANVKPVHYYLNLSLLYLLKRESQVAETICKEGLKKYPTDNELLGNLTIALINQDKLNEAVESATKRISISRNVNSLEEAAGVIYRIAESQKNTEFPTAIKNYKIALAYLKEAKQLNPNFESARLSISNILFKLKKYGESTEETLQVGNTTRVKTIAEVGAFYVGRNLLWTSAFVESKTFCDKQLKNYPDSILLKRVLSETLVDGYVIDNYQDGVRVVEKSSLEFFTSIIKDEKNRLPSDFKFLAKIHSWMGDEENLNYSLLLLRKGLELFPDYWKYNFSISLIYQQNKYFDEALEEAFDAKTKAPWREANCFLISSIYKDKGDIINANKYEQEGIKLKTEKLKLYAQ